jgi:hypothetical protein
LAAPAASKAVTRLLLAAIVALSLWSHLWGLRGDLPWTYASDEGEFAVMGIRMAAFGDPNPRWFGHPGSTYLYPLALLFRVGNAIEAGHSPFAHDDGLAARVGGDPGRYFWLGRLLSVLYAVASLPLVFLIGRRAYDEPVALVATWLAVLSPLALEHAQMMRTDSAGLFFGLLALWLSLRVLDQPTLRAHVLAGLGLGAAIGTRYLLVSLVPVLLVADVIVLRRSRAPGEERRRLLRHALIALGCVALGFFCTTPYFFFDFATVWKNFQHETRTEHLGADGLGFAANLRWYLTSALPASMPLAALLLALLATVQALWRRNAAALLVALSIVAFVLAISTGTLHWQRWLIQVLPLLAVLAAGGLAWIASVLAQRLQRTRAAAMALLIVLTVLLSFGPARAYLRFSLDQAKPSTRVAAREWMIANLEPGSRIAADFYSAPLHDSELVTDYHFALAADGTLQEYKSAGYDYLMVSDAIYGRYQREPKRYAKEVAFYQTLFRTAPLVVRFTPRDVGRGPLISVYALRAAK